MHGAETSTRLAPAVRCFAAPSRSVKRPVHSMTISTPRSRQGSFSGVASDSTATSWPSALRCPSATLILPRKAPMHAVELEQMGVHLGRAEIVDRDEVEILAPGFQERP